MRITVSGTPGSGKSAVSKYLSIKLSIKYFCIGDLMRDFARKKGINLLQLDDLLRKDENLDRKFNEHIKSLNKTDKFILDSRLGFLFINKGMHIFLDADIDVRAKRIFNANRTLEKFRDAEEVKSEINKRLRLEVSRFRKLYKVDFTDLKHYDLVIDTTNMNVKIISDIILKYIKKNDI